MPLRDVAVAVTRTAEDDDPLVGLLRGAGARVVRWPSLAFGPPADDAPLARAAASLAGFDWVVFTSVRAVAPLSERVTRPIPDVAVATVGQATAAVAERAGWRVRLVGDVGSAALATRLGEGHDLSGARVLFPAGSLASDRLATGLSRVGAHVERVEAYRTLNLLPDPDAIRRDLAAGVDFATFTSPSAVRAVTEALGGSLAEVLDGCRVVAIGPSTARALHSAGADTVVVATTPTLADLVESIEAILHSEGVVHVG